MGLLKILTPSIIILLIFGMSVAYCEREKLMDKYFTEKNGFCVALQALKDGHVIHRVGASKRYSNRTIICQNETIVEYGNTWTHDKEFSKGMIFNTDDVFADDWIIEEKK
jgi:hypothetical protein